MQTDPGLELTSWVRLGEGWLESKLGPCGQTDREQHSYPSPHDGGEP